MTKIALLLLVGVATTLPAFGQAARDEWRERTMQATEACLAVFNHTPQMKGKDFSICLTDQTQKAIEPCIGSGRFAECVLENSLRVMRACALSKC